jgi:hypothetical protein
MRLNISIGKRIFLAYMPALFLVVFLGFISFSTMMHNYAVREFSATFSEVCGEEDVFFVVNSSSYIGQALAFQYLIFFAVSCLVIAVIGTFFVSRNVINPMLAQIISEQEQKRSYEILALQNQISPHFLYNTLQSIRFLNRRGEQEKLEKTTLALVRLLSNLFVKNSPPHTLKDELDLVKDYVYIQQMRYGENFKVEYDFDENDMECAMDKLILQPIIENAIFHGLSDIEEGGLISITGRRRGGRFRIKIADNGIGLESIPGDTMLRQGIGLENIQNRLRLLYNSDHLFKLEFPPSGGALVTIEIPS